jgi:hypothetical protein
MASCYKWFPFFLSKSIAFLIPLGTWMLNLYLIPTGIIETLSILVMSTAVIKLKESYLKGYCSLQMK